VILRRRSPDGTNRDVNMGAGPVGNTRGWTARTVGAVQLPDAIAPSWKPTVDVKTQERKAREYARRKAQ
jgi:hypothetical protein